MRAFMKLIAIAIALCLATATATPGFAAEILPALVRALRETRDPQIQLDILRGLRDATAGRPRLPMPEGWDAAERQLMRSDLPEIRSLARSLGLTFGSQTALEALRAAVRDTRLDAAQRLDALRSLVSVRDPNLPSTLRELLSDPAMRGAAIRALAVYGDPDTPDALLAIYSNLSGSERRDALNTLSARAPSAQKLLAAVEAGAIPARDVTADLVRQLRTLKDDGVNELLRRVYGAVRDVAADAQAEIERYKRIYRAGGSTPGDAIRGRAVYARVCQQCHTLFDVGGKVGPDLTGSNRGDLDYILQNIIDPNAVIPNEYVATTIDLADGRVLTGIVQRQDDNSITIATANETVTVPRREVEDMNRSELSMMPEGLLAPLTDQEFRDLIYYLGRPGQAPMLATPDTAGLFFNGADLAFWDGDEEVWSVRDGEIIGQIRNGPAAPQFLRSDLIASDFKLAFEVLLNPASTEAGALFRADPAPQGGARGYEIGLGGDAWGRLVEQGGRGPLKTASASGAAQPREWAGVEISASGARIRASINGRTVADLEDTAGARQGFIAFRFAGPGEIRIRNLRLELQ
jgi:putative heme-binding domain-containing protein